MLIELGPRGLRALDLLVRVAANTLSLGTLFDVYRHNDLSGLRVRLTDVDLAEHVAGWKAWLADRVKPDTSAHYVVQLRTLIPEGKSFLRSAFTAPRIASWLTSRMALVQKRKPSVTQKSRRKTDPTPRGVSADTKRKYKAAAQSFAAYLVEIGVLSANPVRGVSAPPQTRHKPIELELADVKRIVDGAVPPYRALFALLYGAGVEICPCVRRVGRERKTAARFACAKAHTRDRIVRIASGRGHTSKNTSVRSRRASDYSAASIAGWSVLSTGIG
jgi:hypothetical protein